MLASLAHIDLEYWRHRLSQSDPLQALELLQGAIDLALKAGFVALEQVRRCRRGS